MPILTESLALSLALIFAAAAISKLTAWSELPGIVRNFRVLPRTGIMPVAIMLPPLEGAIAAGLLITSTRPIAAFSAAVLSTIFGAALAVNYSRGRRHIDCGCFRSDLKQPISIALILRNGVLAVAALSMLMPGGTPTPSPLAWAIAVAGALSFFLCYLSIGVLFQAPAPSYEDNFHAARAIGNAR